jgi:hypothetical protein
MRWGSINILSEPEFEHHKRPKAVAVLASTRNVVGD